MPIYEYVCPTCGEFEQMQKITEPVLTVCPLGHAGVERKISAAGFILKGSGWYITDYQRKGANGSGAKNGHDAGSDTGSAERSTKSEPSATDSGATKAAAAAGGSTAKQATAS